jgi:S-adenosylhomocysteine hydrolase
MLLDGRNAVIYGAGDLGAGIARALLACDRAGTSRGRS